jgi:hypothetical protein
MSDTLARGRRSSLRSLVFSKFTTSDWNKLSASVWQAGMGHRSFSNRFMTACPLILLPGTPGTTVHRLQRRFETLKAMTSAANEPRETFHRSLIPPANDTIKGIQAMVNARLLTVVEEDTPGWKA